MTNEYWKKKYADVHIRLTNKIAELQEQLSAKEKECQEAMDCYVQLDLQRIKENKELVDKYKAIEQECERLKEKYKWYDHYKEQALYNKKLCNKKSEQLDQLKVENEKLKQYKGSKQASYESMQIEWNEAKNEVKKLKAENEELKEEIDDLKEIIQRHDNDNNSLLSEFEDDLVEHYRKYKECLTEIKEIADGMHDLWINKTPYTDIDNLVKHLLECELNRIRYKFDDISEVE